MISQSAEYALRAVVWLAGSPDSVLSTQDIARATRVPAGYLSKVLLTPGQAWSFPPLRNEPRIPSRHLPVLRSRLVYDGLPYRSSIPTRAFR